MNGFIDCIGEWCGTDKAIPMAEKFIMMADTLKRERVNPSLEVELREAAAILLDHPRDLTDVCDCDDQRLAPLDFVTGWVDVERDPVSTGPHPSSLQYDPTGWTEVHWDAQTTIGYGCRSCGGAIIDRTIFLNGHRYTREG